MADEEQAAILRQEPQAWNAWRREHPGIVVDLREADLSDAILNGTDLREADLGKAILQGADLFRANLDGADLTGAKLIRAILVEAELNRANLHIANLSDADLTAANLFRADLGNAKLSGADLIRADLRKANLRMANLSGADLSGADLSGADLHEANLREATLIEANLSGTNLNIELSATILANLDLSSCKGLDRCLHFGPSVIDHRTLQRSGPLPLYFLRGVGLPDNLIDYLPSLLNQSIQFYSCFISYSSNDREFAARLHADLQAKGVRCWFAPEEMKIGDEIEPTIDMAIRLREKLLLVLSETAMASAWVAREVRTGIAEEQQHSRKVLFPVRLDDAVMNTTEQWAYDIKRKRHIGDFTCWKDHDAYQKALKRLLRDLKVESKD